MICSYDINLQNRTCRLGGIREKNKTRPSNLFLFFLSSLSLSVSQCQHKNLAIYPLKWEETLADLPGHDLLPLLRHLVAVIHLALVHGRLPLAHRIQHHRLHRPPKRLAPLHEREDAHRRRAAEQPQNPHGHPSREELPAEDVRAAVHGHGPEDDERERHEHGDGPRDERRFLELRLLGVRLGVCLGGFHGRAVVLRGGGGGDGALAAFGIRRSGLPQEGAVVDFADLPHGDPVVVLAAEGEGQDGDEDQRAAEGGDVACEHGVAVLVGGCVSFWVSLGAGGILCV